MRNDQLSRQWLLLQRLEGSRGATLQELVDSLPDDFPKHPRTIRRDLLALEVAGFPLLNERRDGQTVWRLMDGARGAPAVTFSTTELMSLTFSRNLLKPLEGTEIQASLLSALQKASAALPPAGHQYLREMEGLFHVGIGPHKTYREHRATIDCITAAISQSRTLQMRYFTASRDSNTRREVDPYRLWYAAGGLYLIAYCHLRRDVRLFAVERIQSLSVTDHPYQYPLNFDIEAYVRDALMVMRGPPVTVELLFDKKTAVWARDKVCEGLPENREEWDEEQKALWLLANQLNYFRREDKCAWWEVFRIRELEHEELLEERNVISELEFIKTMPYTGQIPIHRYRFPVQEESVDVGKRVEDLEGNRIGTVVDIDHLRRLADIKKTGNSANVHPTAIVVDHRISTKDLASSLLAFGKAVAESGVDGSAPYRAARDLLLRKPPRLSGATGGGLRGYEVAVEAARRLVPTLDRSVLPIQGPPGSGKTFTGARLIVTLARLGKRIGVTAVSHKVIRNLLEKALVAAREEGVSLNAVHKDKLNAVDPLTGVTETKDNNAALDAMVPGNLVGGTAWLWSRDDTVESVDYLIVDEAGQMSLAHVFAAARAAHNLVLLGDPQQLEQPQRGAHPEGSEVAALDYVLGGAQTIPEDKGLFLDITWRLHPDICAFTSELYYEGRLKARKGLEKQAIVGDLPFAGSGLFYVPVEHEGNQNRSMEEVETVSRVS